MLTKKPRKWSKTQREFITNNIAVREVANNDIKRDARSMWRLRQSWRVGFGLEPGYGVFIA